LAEADGLALLEFEGAQRLRQWGWQGPILMLEGPFGPEDLASASALDLSLVIHHAHQQAWLAAYSGLPLKIWLKVNTGMNRLGIPPDQAASVYQLLSGLPGVASVAWMTHFAKADQEGGTEAAFQSFCVATQGCVGARSLANSAALLTDSRVCGDWVRPGIMLYGATPIADRPAAQWGLQAAMRLESSLIAVQDVAAGASVGYGGMFVATRRMRVGVVACGYADGYPRHAPTGTPIAVAGIRTRTLGRVSMDMLAVDLEPVPDAKVGAPVELWGTNVPVDAVASAAGTIGYELLCAVAPRVARRVTK